MNHNRKKQKPFAEIWRTHVRQAVESTGQDLAKAAQTLGVTEDTLSQWMAKLNIEIEESEGSSQQLGHQNSGDVA